jgi:type IV pilus assembly protein PilC
MAKFEYIALDARGQESRGVIEASNQNEAVGQLRQAGYFPTNVVEEGKGGLPKANKKQQKAMEAAAAPKAKKGGITLFSRKTISSKTLMIFTRQLATLIDAGLPLLRGLTVLSKQEKDPVLKNTINALADSVQGGSTFSESMAQHPKIFNKLYINMVKAGELGGVLELVLNRLAEFQEKAQRIKNKVVSAMAYPVIVLAIAVLIMGFLLAFIVPRFEAIFRDMLSGKPLPALTQGVINASNFVKTMFIPPNLWITLGSIIALVVVWKLVTGNPTGQRVLDKIKLRMPLFGDLTRKSSISRFSRTLGTLVTSGVPILQALNITRDTAGNAIVAEAVTKVHDAVKKANRSWLRWKPAASFRRWLFRWSMSVKRPGSSLRCFLKIAEVYDDEVDNAVEGLTSLLEPIMIVILALIVGTIVIALFLPLISIIQNLSNSAGGA